MIKLLTVISARRRPDCPAWGWCAFLLFLLFMASCSSDDDGGSAVDNLTTVQLYVSVPALPADDGTRIGDPGQDDGEDQSAWNTLTLMFEYFDEDGTTATGERHLYTITAGQFNSLPSLSENENIKRVTLPMTEGRVKVYGVTYSDDAGQDIKTQTDEWAAGGSVQLQDLTISNDYANGDQAERAKYLSVATGFYDENKDGTPDIFNIETVISGDLGGSIPVMTLTRLAAKIDIQWDAREAYGSGYSDVKVTDFTFSGDDASVTGSGSGRLFPSLYEGSVKLSGSKTFVNQTPISQRNGRVYHYVYPDGVSTPKVTFRINAKDKNGGSVERNYTFTFNAALQKATWYKIRTFIEGFTNQKKDITITPEGPGGEAVTTE